MGPSSVQSAQKAAVGYRVGGVPLFADKMWVGMSALSWAISHPSTHMCLQAESAIAPILMQLREVLFLWGILDPRANPSGEGMREGTLARTYRPPRCLDWRHLRLEKLKGEVEVSGKNLRKRFKAQINLY